MQRRCYHIWHSSIQHNVVAYASSSEHNTLYYISAENFSSKLQLIEHDRYLPREIEPGN
jgi:hypothetical protein